MAKKVGLEVVDLSRLRLGSLKLAGLPEGAWRELGTSDTKILAEDLQRSSKVKDKRTWKTAVAECWPTWDLSLFYIYFCSWGGAFALALGLEILMVLLETAVRENA